MADPFGIPFLPSYNLASPGGILALLLAIGMVGICVHLAARTLAKKDDIYRAFTAATLGVLLALLAYALVPAYWIVGFLLAIVAFFVAIGVVYRAKPQAAAAVGAVAWVLWIVANFAIKYVQDHWRP